MLGHQLHGRGWRGVRSVALVATALFALYPANIVCTSVLYSDVVFTLPFAVATVLLADAGARLTRGQAIAIGLGVGSAAIIRPQAVVLLGAGAAYWLLRSDGKEAASVNADTTVNSTDQLIVAQSFSMIGAPKYVRDFDVNRDDHINSTDLLMQAKAYGAC